ncbi:MAG TPA: RcnB family protein [Caulobacteraceae bacterium]|nr:RcnB family protein [Caulobacteraceae bacterium]
MRLQVTVFALALLLPAAGWAACPHGGCGGAVRAPAARSSAPQRSFRGGQRPAFGGGINRGAFGGGQRSAFGGGQRSFGRGAINRGGYFGGGQRSFGGRSTGGHHGLGATGSSRAGGYAGRSFGGYRGRSFGGRGYAGAGGRSGFSSASGRHGGGTASNGSRVGGRSGSASTGGAHAAAARSLSLASANARPPRASGGGRYTDARGRGEASFDGGGYAWPSGYSYTAFAIGAFLPAVFWRPDYFVNDWGYYGVGAPGYDCSWIRYGPDLLLIRLDTGAIIRVVHGVYRQGGYRAYADPDALPGDPPPPGL